MKNLKLNKKGFTLIELLAVIVILAVIMAVTIPTVLNTMGDARQNTLNTSAETVAEWFEKEYSLAQLGQASSAFTTLCGATGSGCTSAKTLDAATLRAAGVDPANYNTTTPGTVTFTGSRACVSLTANTEAGDFKGVTTATVKSVGCPN